MNYLIYLLITIFPVFVLNYFPASFVTPKLGLLLIALVISILIWIVKSILKSSIHFSIGKFDLAVFLIAASYLLSTLLTKVNAMEAFFFPGVVTFVLAGGILYFLINQFKKNEKEGANFALILSGVLLSLSVILTETKVLSNFNALGGIVPTSIYLAALSPILVLEIVREKDLVKRAFLAVSALVIVLGFGIGVKNALPGQPQSPRFLSPKVSWEIAVESLKQNPLFGIGSGNYLTAFNKYRSVSYNQGDLWSIKFTSANNFYFTLITELGFLGLASILFLLFAIYKAKSISLAAILILFALLPATGPLLILLFVLLALNSKSEDETIELASNKVAVSLISAPFVLAIIALGYFGTRAFLAEYKFKMAIDALSKNNAQETYKKLGEAIKLSPKVDRYHASFAQVDMALASSIASKKDITDTDRNTISQLVGHAINEAKIAVNLNKERSGNWEILARVYRSIMPFAQGADNFAVQAFAQAISLDPVSPNLRISLGGTHFALGRFDEAIEAFKLATLTKPDLANAHYNLAIAYREKKEFKKATDEMNIVLSLVGKDSASYEVALKELKNIEELTPPEPIEESNIKPPIELP